MEIRQTAVALGFFDGVHRGHRRVIEKAVELANGNLTPAVFTFTMNESGPAKKQGAGEITTLEQKIRILKSMGIQQIYAPEFSDFCNLSGEEFVSRILKEKMNAAAVCCGRDFRFGKGASCDAAALFYPGAPRHCRGGDGKSPSAIGPAVLSGFSGGAWQSVGT